MAKQPSKGRKAYENAKNPKNVSDQNPQFRDTVFCNVLHDTTDPKAR